VFYLTFQAFLTAGVELHKDNAFTKILQCNYPVGKTCDLCFQ